MAGKVKTFFSVMPRPVTPAVVVTVGGVTAVDVTEMLSTFVKVVELVNTKCEVLETAAPVVLKPVKAPEKVP